MEQRFSAGATVEVFYAIEDMGRALCFGYSTMSLYHQRCEAFGGLVGSIARSKGPHNLLHDKVMASGTVIVSYACGWS